MTFDIDATISEAFAKRYFQQQEDGSYIDNDSANEIKDATNTFETKKKEFQDADKALDFVNRYDVTYSPQAAARHQDRRDKLRGERNEKYNNMRAAAEEMGDARRNSETLDPYVTEDGKTSYWWNTPMADYDARRARWKGGIGEPSREDAAQAARRQAAKKAGTSKVTTPQGMADAVPEKDFMFGEVDTNRKEFANLLSYLEGKGMPRNEAYYWLRDQYSKKGNPTLFDGIESLGIKGGNAWELPARSTPGRPIPQYDPNTTKVPMEQINKSFDIDSRMKQWTAANHSPHSDQTESILKSTEGFQKTRVPLPEGLNRKDRLAALEESIDDPRVLELFKILASGLWFSDDPNKAMEEAASLAAASAAKDQTHLTEIPEKNYYRGRMEDAQNSEAPMNQIGANKPREEVVQTIYGEEPYYDRAYGNYLPRDVGQEVEVTESGPYDDGFEWAPPVGLTDRAKAILEEMQGAGDEGDFEGE